MQDQTYNGWTNYETWAANLWLTNDPGTYEMLSECETVDEVAYLVEQVIDFGAGGAVLNTASLASDLLQKSIDRIDYARILDSIRED